MTIGGLNTEPSRVPAITLTVAKMPDILKYEDLPATYGTRKSKRQIRYALLIKI
jgi:hypothetical protein